MNAILLPSESSQPTTTSTSPAIDVPQPTAAPANVVWLKFEIEPQVRLPPKFRRVRDLVDEFEVDEEGRADMLEARQWVRQTFFREQSNSLASYRLRRGWSQKRLADEINTSQPHIARLESGRADAQLSTLKKIASALQVSLLDVVSAIEAKSADRHER